MLSDPFFYPILIKKNHGSTTKLLTCSRVLLWQDIIKFHIALDKNISKLVASLLLESQSAVGISVTRVLSYLILICYFSYSFTEFPIKHRIMYKHSHVWWSRHTHTETCSHTNLSAFSIPHVISICLHFLLCKIKMHETISHSCNLKIISIHKILLLCNRSSGRLLICLQAK